MSKNETKQQAPDTHYIVITDLDGTLLDHHDYSWDAAQPALDFLSQQSIPVVINTSKTANEVITLQKKIGLQSAFIVENGSAIFVPETEKIDIDPNLSLRGDFRVKVLGEEKAGILEKLHNLRTKHSWKFEGFSDWNTQQIVEATGLSYEAASEASQREFSEPLVWKDSEENYLKFRKEIKALDLKILKGGRFIHVLGKTNKGKASQWLKSLYEKHFNQSYRCITLGDGPNDIDMLKASDIAVLVKSPAHDFPEIERSELKGMERMVFTTEYGPKGWNEAISTLKSVII